MIDKLVRRFDRDGSTRGAGRVMCGTLLIAIVGCSSFRSPATLEIAADELPVAKVADPAPAASPAAVEIDALRTARWYKAPLTASSLPRQTQWRSDAIDRVFQATQRDRAGLVELLAHHESLVASHAAITLARHDDPCALDRLVSTVADPQLPLGVRQAAAESIGLLSTPAAVDALRRLIDSTCGVATDENTKSVYLPELHAELLAALGPRVDAVTEPRVVPTREQNWPSDVKLAALRAWNQPRPGEVPAAVAQWRSDVDARVRQHTIQALARRQSSQALAAAQAGLNDAELDVRLAAIAALGTLGTPEARKALAPLATHSGEIVRAAVVEALDLAGDRHAVFKAVEDKSWCVRRAVADVLSLHADAEHLPLAERLLSDRSVEVQRQMVDALTSWPTPLAGPLLITALERSTYATKKAALGQLADRWPPAREHSLDWPAEQATAALEQLKLRWRAEFGEPEKLASAVAPTLAANDNATLTDAQAEHATRALATLRSAAPANAAVVTSVDTLIELGPALIPWLAQQELTAGREIPLRVYREVLPKLAPEFVALLDLEAPEVATRRQAAERLQQQAAREPLSTLVVERLTQVSEREKDPLVWRSLLHAVRSRTSSATCRLAYLAIGQSSDEIRRLSCELLAQQPAPEHAAVLLPALDDPRSTVVRAALAALAKPGVLRDPAPLLPLLAVDDRRVRVEAAAALVALEHEAGFAALERLVFDGDLEVRRSAIQQMGKLARPEFQATLVRLLDQGEGIGQTAAASLQQIVGDDVARKVTAESQSSAERVAAWRRWWDQQR